MHSKKSKIISSIVFVLGLVLIILVSLLINQFSKISNEKVYLWASIAGMYLVLWCPHFINFIPVKNESKKNRSILTVVLGTVIFLIISIGITVSVVFNVFQILIAIVVEVVLLFLYALNVYYSYISPTHSTNADEKSKEANSLIMQIKTSIDAMKMKASTLGTEYNSEKDKLNSFVQTISNFTMVDDIAAAKLEQEILQQITLVSSACDKILSGSASKDFDKELAALDKKISQRIALEEN